jgi:hypothetical protein
VEIYQRIKNIQSKRWNIEEKENKFIIALTDSIWFYNPINMPFFKDDAGFSKYAKSGGFKGIYELYLEYEEKWSPQNLADTENKNELIKQKLAKLPEKYNIAHLSHKFDSYIGNSDEEKERIKKYEREKEVLGKKLTRLPDFHTNNYSIFISDNRPFEFYQIWPYEASQDAFELKEILKRIFKGQAEQKGCHTP